MGFDKQNQKQSGSTAGNSSNEIGLNVVIDDGVFQGPCDASQVKQQISELENIIMEGDIILNIHADGETDDGAQKEFQVDNTECTGHSNFYLHQDETLLKIGDKFESHKDFVKYLNNNANRWCFYYQCTESENADTDIEAYTYSCLYLRNRDYKRKGAKKRYNSKTDCPSKVKLRRWPGQYLTVISVCNHHDHELSKDQFQKMQHNKKLSPYIKEIIMDLLALEVEIGKIRKFVEMEIDVKMSHAFFYEMEKKMKLKNEERQISDKRLKELSDKMCVVDEMYSCDEDENTEEQMKPINKRLKLSSSEMISHVDGNTTAIIEMESTNDKEDNSWAHDQSAPHKTATSEWDHTTMTETETIEEDNNDHYEEAVEETEHYTAEDTNEPIQTTENAQENSFQPYGNVVLQDEFGNIINDERIVILQPDENGIVQGENGTIGYFDGEQIIYVQDPNQENEQEQEQNQSNDAESSSACDAAVQTSSSKPGHSFVPVFDVFMKNGNVTGFLVNDNLVKGTGEKSAQPQDDEHQNTPQLSEATKESLCDISTSNATQEFLCGEIYTKHEYIHRYNIDNYMTNPQFPKYIDTLAKKTRTDVMHMLARVYNEKAMFKMTTTQKGKEGNTKIWYLTDVRRKGKYKMSDEEKMKKDKLGQYITDILILKERVKLLKKENEELITRNKYLEEVALRLAKMNESN